MSNGSIRSWSSKPRITFNAGVSCSHVRHGACDVSGARRAPRQRRSARSLRQARARATFTPIALDYESFIWEFGIEGGWDARLAVLVREAHELAASGTAVRACRLSLPPAASTSATSASSA